MPLPSQGSSAADDGSASGVLPGGLRLLVILFVGLLLVVEVALAQSWLAVRATGAVAEENASVIGSFGDVQRQLNAVRINLVATQDVGAPQVQRELDLLGRQVSLGHRRIDDPDEDAETVLFILELENGYERMRDATDVDELLDLATHWEVRAKVNHDRIQQAARRGMLQQVGDTTATAWRTAGVAVLVLLLGALFLVSLARRYRMVYADAYEETLAKAEELALANRRLLAADALREHFVSVTSHELRSPLAVISGSTETLLHRAKLLDEKQRGLLLTGIARAAERQTRLVEDLLDAARRGNTAMSAKPVSVETAPIVDEVVERVLRPTGREVRVNLAPGCVALADRDHVERIVENLVVNAGKYGGPTVWVSTSCEGETVLVTVEDDGSGVPPEFRDRLFEPFAQMAHSPSGSGVGLGLSIVQDLAVANGGSISYQDRDGGGSRFELVLPRQRPSAPAA